MRLHTKCILRFANPRYPFYCATPSGNSPRMRGLPPGIDSSAKGIKSLSISGIPERRRRRRRHSPRLRRFTQFTRLLTVSRFTNLTPRWDTFYCVQRRSLMKYCVASFVLYYYEAGHNANNGAARRYDAKLALDDGFNFVQTLYLYFWNFPLPRSKNVPWSLEFI